MTTKVKYARWSVEPVFRLTCLFYGMVRRAVTLLLQLVFFLTVVGSTIAAETALSSYGAAEPFREGDVVSYIGDSITHTGSYPSLISLFYSTRFPTRKITYFNAGFSGDQASAVVGDEAYRMTVDILGHRPTVVTVMLGMNDVGRGNFGATKTSETFVAARAADQTRYERSMAKLLARLQESGARVILLTPSPYDDTVLEPVEKARFMSSGRDNALGTNAALGKFAALVRTWSHDRNTGLVDFYATMTAIDWREQAHDPKFTLISVDRIHPGVVGHFVMTYTFLKAQCLEGIVASLAVDAATRKVSAAENCSVLNVKTGNRRLDFDVLEKALPFPVPADARPALAVVPFAAEFNREPVIITGLNEGRHRLEIDGVAIGEFSRAELQAGVDVASSSLAPQNMQAAEAGRIAGEHMEAVLKERDAAINRYVASKAGINVADPVALRAYADAKLAEFAASKKTPDLRFQRFLEALAEPDKFEKEEAALTRALRQACQPRLHHFSVITL